MKEACLEKDQLKVIFEIATDMGKLVKTSAQRNGNKGFFDQKLWQTYVTMRMVLLISK